MYDRHAIVDRIVADLCIRWALTPTYVKGLMEIAAKKPGLPPMGDFTPYGATPVESQIINDVINAGISLSELHDGQLRRCPKQR